MENNNATCKKCKKNISKANIELHEGQCREVVTYDNFELEYKYCQNCDNYFQANEFSDHQLVHQFENEDRNNYVPERSSEEMEIDSDADINEEPHVNRFGVGDSNSL
jgi:hypothetical protein